MKSESAFFPIEGAGPPEDTGHLHEGLSQKLDSETCHRWQLELDDFVKQTRLRLNSLSQSLAQCQIEQQRIIEETCEIPDREEPSAENPDEVQTAPTSSDVSEPHVEPQVGPAESIAGLDDSDPMERLNAIKLRLAEQIENS